MLKLTSRKQFHVFDKIEDGGSERQDAFRFSGHKVKQN